MGVGHDSVMGETRRVGRVDVNGHVAEMGDAVEEVVSHVQGACVPLLHREAGIDGDGNVRFETVSHPPDADVGNRLDVRDGVGR